MNSAKGLSEWLAMTNNLPKVSILTPVLNAMDYLEECISSVQNQRYPNYEHVFADGGSTDGTIERLIKESEKRPGQIKIVKTKKRGVGAGLKAAFEASDGEIIGWLDADDRYENQAFFKAIKYFKEDDKCSFIFGNANLIDQKSNQIGEFIIRDYDKSEWINRWHYIVFCSTFFRRQVVNRVGFVNDLGNDVDFYIRVSKKFKLMKVDDLFASWRLHSSGISLSPSKREKNIRRQRMKQDFLIAVKNGGSIMSPKSMIYLVDIANSFYSHCRFVLRPFEKVLRKFRRFFELWIAESLDKNQRNYFVGFISSTSTIIWNRLAASLKLNSSEKSLKLPPFKKNAGIKARLMSEISFLRLFFRHLRYSLVTKK